MEQAAVLGTLARVVYSIEQFDILAHRALSVLSELGYTNVNIVIGDGSCGWEAESPYDAIIVTAAAPKAPFPLLEQLTDGGVLVLPVGNYRMQILQRWSKVGDEYTQEDIIPVAFVPLRGDFGWSNSDWRR